MRQTAVNWADSLWVGSTWIAERDTDRIRETFRRLIAESKRWPQPSQFRERLPALPPSAPALSPPRDDAVRVREMRRISELLTFADRAQPKDDAS